MSLKQMIQFGLSVDEEKIVRSAQIVQAELPVRLAHRLMDLQTLPHVCITNPYIQDVFSRYVDAFRRLEAMPTVQTLEDDEKLSTLLRQLVDNTNTVVETLGQGMAEVTRKLPAVAVNVNDFLDRMLMSRIGRRVLAEHHIMLHRAKKRTPDGWVGVINTRCSPHHALLNSVEKATEICRRTFGDAPDVIVTGDLGATIPYIPYHLEYIFLEILKNSMRATMENVRIRPPVDNGRPPPIEVLIGEGSTELLVRISDRGGGVPASVMERAFDYCYTTFDHSAVLTNEGQGGLGMLGNVAAVEVQHSPIAGFGFGLPLSRSYARYFGGDLRMLTLEGFGSEVYVTLDRTGDKVEKVEI